MAKIGDGGDSAPKRSDGEKHRRVEKPSPIEGIQGENPVGSEDTQHQFTKALEEERGSTETPPAEGAETAEGLTENTTSEEAQTIRDMQRAALLGKSGIDPKTLEKKGGKPDQSR